MLITSQPASWNHFDSARVEKRGPWIVTTVPPSRPVAREECDALVPNLAAHARRRRLAVRSLDFHFLDVLEERVEAGAPEDPDLSARHAAASLEPELQWWRRLPALTVRFTFALRR